MFYKIKLISLTISAVFMLQACHDDDYVATSDSPVQVLDFGDAGYAQLRADSGANGLFIDAAEVAGTNPEIGEELCDVKIHKMTYDTVGGAGEATKSTGVVMVPHGSDPACTGPRPVMLYAHGTTPDRDYDLSDFSETSSAVQEGTILLAFYASQGYIVVAPNYAGYDDSTLTYHPYLDEAQQSTEMIDALEHFRKHADNINANVSSKLFVSGLSQGGYVAMATHKALEAKGETVTASMPVSGPYAMTYFLDEIMTGYVNSFSTLFAPMYLTAAQKRSAIYDSPSDIYYNGDSNGNFNYADSAEGSLPRTGGFEAAVTSGSLPPLALFNIAEKPVNPSPALTSVNEAGYGSAYLIKDSVREAYINDISTNGDTPVYKLRKVVKKADLRTDWSPASNVYMCGSKDDTVVYHENSNLMKAHLAQNSFVSNLELSDVNSGTPTKANEKWNIVLGGVALGAVSEESIHGLTGPYCAAAALEIFKDL